VQTCPVPAGQKVFEIRRRPGGSGLVLPGVAARVAASNAGSA